MKRNVIILLACLLLGLLLVNVANVAMARGLGGVKPPLPIPWPPVGGYGGNNPGNTPGTDPNNPANSTNTAQIKWQGDSISAAVRTGTKEKKVIFLYCFFDKVKEDFPNIISADLQAYSEKEYIFTKIWVITTKNKWGATVALEPANAEFFHKTKLPLVTVGAALDPYGNLMDKIYAPFTPDKITKLLDDAKKKYLEIETDLNTRYALAEKTEADLNAPDNPKQKEKNKTVLLSNFIKTIVDITKMPYEGYDAITKANDKVKEYNDKATKEYSDIIKDYAAVKEENRDPKKVTPELEQVMKRYKGLPVETDIKNAIKDIKSGKIPESIQKEMKPEPKDKPLEPKTTPPEPKVGK